MSSVPVSCLPNSVSNYLETHLSNNRHHLYETNSQGKKIPISDEKYKQFLKEVKEITFECFHKNSSSSPNSKEAEKDKKAAEQDKKAAEHAMNMLLTSAKQKAAAADLLSTSSQMKNISGQQKIESSEAHSKNAEATRKDIVSRMFYAIFHGMDPLPADQANSIYDTYLSDGSITYDREKKQLHSMTSVINYLDKNTKVSKLNFKSFKEHVLEVGTLAAHLGKSSCSVKSVGINKNISATDKASLDAAVKERKGTLKVTYFDN